MRKQIVVALVVGLSVPGMAFAGVNAVPEPETLALLAIGAAAIAVARWVRRK